MEESKSLKLDRLTKRYLGEDEFGHLRCLVCDKIFKYKSRDPKTPKPQNPKTPSCIR